MALTPARPICSIVPESLRYARKAIRGLMFEDERLTLNIEGDGFGSACLVFDGVVGFRVLDERDLAEFWNEQSEPNGWLWEVQSGGWCDLERARSTFSSAALFTDMREYLVVDDKCISVLFRGGFTLKDFGADRTIARQ